MGRPQCTNFKQRDKNAANAGEKLVRRPVIHSLFKRTVDDSHRVILRQPLHESPEIRFREAAANGVGRADPAALENISPAFFFSPFLK